MNRDDYERLKIIFYDPSKRLQTKQRLLQNEFGLTMSRQEIKDTIRTLKAKMPKNKHAAVKSRKNLPENREPRVRGAGEGAHTWKSEVRRLLAEAGVDIPAGYDVHHINGDHNDNRLENLSLIKPKKHIELHRVFDRDNLFRNYHNMSDEEKLYYRKFGAKDFDEMPRYKVPMRRGADMDELEYFMEQRKPVRVVRPELEERYVQPAQPDYTQFDSEVDDFGVTAMRKMKKALRWISKGKF